MKRYLVPVINRKTGEHVLVLLSAHGPTDAMRGAVLLMYKRHRWSPSHAQWPWARLSQSDAEVA